MASGLTWTAASSPTLNTGNIPGLGRMVFGSVAWGSYETGGSTVDLSAHGTYCYGGKQIGTVAGDGLYRPEYVPATGDAAASGLIQMYKQSDGGTTLIECAAAVDLSGLTANRWVFFMYD